MAISFTLNGKSQSVEVDPQMPLLWVLRDTLNMTGTKFGCGMALCGACTVHINGEAARSCITPISAAALLAKKASPSDAEIDDFMSGNICRCGTYQRIRKAIHRAAEIRSAQGKSA